LLLATVLLMLSAASLPAQQLTGSVSGTVTDTSGAVIPGADVTLVNDASGETRRSVSNADGYFTLASVFAGTYTLNVSSEGFQKLELTNITLGVGDNRNVTGIELQIGATAETVTVMAQVDSMVPLDSGEISNTITEKQLQNLAVVGRSAAELIKILPGMAATGGGVENRPGFTGEAIGINGNGDGGQQSALGFFSANGTRPESMDIVSDGAHVSDPGCNCATPVNPNVDMLQEFKVLRGNYGAEHSKGPVVMSSVSKQGGSEFHGTGYYYMRDYRWNANEFLLNRSGQERPKNKYKFPGFNIGGPITTKGDNNKAFFFFGIERFLQTIDTGVLQSNVPDAQMANGDFSNQDYLSLLNSGQVNSPLNDEFPNQIIPQTQINTTGRIMTGLLPQPNVQPGPSSGGFNYVNALTLDQNMWQVLGRVDYNFTDMTKLFVRFNRQDETQNFPVGLWWRNANQVPYPTPVTGDNVSNSFTANLSHVLDPTSTNEFIFSLTHINFPNSFEDPSAVSKESLGVPFGGIFDNPGQHIPALTSWGGAPTMLNPGGFDPVLFAKKYLLTVGDNFSKVVGTHTLKFGAFYEHVINNQPANPYSNGFFITANWGGNSTGNALGDLLAGRAAQYQESSLAVPHNLAFDTIEWYAQDSWKVTPRFTLDYGLRFAHLGAWQDREGVGLAVFNPGSYDPNAPLEAFSGLAWNAIDSSIPLSGGTTAAVFVSPRVGFAWDAFGSGRTVIRGGFGMFRYHDPQGPFPGAVDIPLGQRNVNLTSANTFDELEALQPSQQRVAPTTIDPNDNTQPITYNWSLMFANRLPGQITWEIGYVGSASRDLLNDGFRDINLVPLGAMLSLDDPSQGNPDNFRPFQAYSNLNVIRHNLEQDYHSLQTTFSRQVGRANITANYTWGKATGIRGGNQGQRADQLNPENNRGVLAYDRKHIFNLAYVYQFPDFASNAGWNGAAKAIMDGWQISGITQWSSGVDLQAAGANANFGLNAATPDGGLPISNLTVLGTDAVTLQPHLTCDPTQGLGPSQYINANCFALPTVGSAQNGTVVFPTIRGPNFQNHDISVFKDWNFDEHRRLQFRFSAYNFLNRPNESFTNGDGNLNLNFNAQGVQTNDRFGFADAKFGRRIIQMAIKFYF